MKLRKAWKSRLGWVMPILVVVGMTGFATSARADAPVVIVTYAGHSVSEGDETGIRTVTVNLTAEVTGDANLRSECGEPEWIWSPQTYGGTPYGEVSGNGTSGTLTANFTAGTGSGTYSASATATAKYPANEDHPVECATEQEFSDSITINFEILGADPACGVCDVMEGGE